MSAPQQGLKNWVRQAALRKIKQAPVPDINTWRIVRGDKVQIMAGRDKGKQGKVLRVIRKQNRILVEGCNLVRKHVKPSPQRPGGVYAVEGPMHYSNASLVDPVSGLVSKDGEKVRVSRSSGSVIAKPSELTIRRTPRREPGPSDTLPSDVHKVTYEPPAYMRTSTE